MKRYMYLILCINFIFSCGQRNEESADEVSTEDTSQMQSEKGEEKEMIQVEYPKAGQIVSSPLKLRGKARGYWYFEGDFPVELRDMDGNTLVSTYASAKSEWMTEEFVPFESKLAFDAGNVHKGILILHRANPSGLPEHDRSITIPLKFE